jgi:hypothetical protein
MSPADRGATSLHLQCNFIAPTKYETDFPGFPSYTSVGEKSEKLGAQSSFDFMTIRFLSGLLKVTGRHPRQVNVVRRKQLSSLAFIYSKFRRDYSYNQSHIKKNLRYNVVVHRILHTVYCFLGISLISRLNFESSLSFIPSLYRSSTHIRFL